MGQIDIWDMVGAYPVCGNCGSTQVVRDAWAEWNLGSGDWELKTVFDEFACDKCGESNTPNWEVDKEFRLKRIRRLNDAARRGTGDNAMIVVTAGVEALGQDVLADVFREVAEFDAFSEDNDPHGEHDFGEIDLKGEKLFWKIDYFDRDLKMLTLDPANPVLTCRVLTVMLAREY